MSVETVNGHVLLPDLPNWRDPVEWSRRWQTDVATSLPGGEFRAGMRANPLLSLKFTTEPTEGARPQLEDRLRQALLTGTAAVPCWGRGQVLDADVTASSVQLEASAYIPQAGDFLFFWSEDGHEAIEVLSYVAGTITLVAPVSRTYRTGNFCWPMLFGVVDVQEVQSLTPAVDSYRISFSELEPTSLKGVGGGSDGTGGAAITSHAGLPVYLFGLNWAASPGRGLQYDPRQEEIGFGAPQFNRLNTDLGRSWTGEIELVDDSAIEDFQVFANAMKGRLSTFYFPDTTEAVEIVAGHSATEFDIISQDIGNAVSTWLLFVRNDEIIIDAVSSSTDLGNGRERVTTTFGPFDETWQCFRMFKARFADDVERATFSAEGRQTRSVRVVVPADEYRVTHQPVWLYHFWIETNTPIHWYYTSHESDFVSGGHTYSAKPITHGAIKRNIRADSEEVTITTWFDDDNPFRLFLPFPASSLLRLEIHEDSVDVGDRQLRYTGIVREPMFIGKKITAKLASFLAELDRKVPAHLFQPRCNYALFDGSCGLSRATFEETGTFLSISNRTVRVDLPGFATADPNYFDKGELQVGDSDEFEIRTILSGSLVSGTQWDLNLNYPLQFAAVSDAVSVWPGCDGRLSTCGTKFTNSDAFGGFPFVPLKNLTLTAIRANSGGGKKG